MPTTLLTGGNGFVGSGILAQLLSQPTPHHVICTIRNPSSGQALLSAHPEWNASLISFTTVADFTKEGAFDAIFKDHPEIDYVIHCAAPLTGDPRATDFVEHFEKPNVVGNIGLLSSAHNYGPNTQAVAVTGSINAVTTGAQDDIKARVFTSDEWLPYTREDAMKMDNNFINYCVSKKMGEEAIWAFVKDRKPKFHVSVFLPALIFGPMQQKVDSIEKVNFSMGQVYSILNSSKSEMGTVPDTAFPGYIDLRDLAHVHIGALTNPAAANKRFLVGIPFTYDQFAAAMRTDSEFQNRVGKDNGEVLALPKIDMGPIEKVFGIKWRTMEETAVDCARDLVRVEKLSC